jgi:AcrR family transcriptional regulator
MATRGDRRTRQRLLEAASALFAETGFHGAKVRDIASGAGANIAAANYHFGSKEQLYLEVLRTHFAEIRARLVDGAMVPDKATVARMTRAELEAILKKRLATMLDVLVGPPPAIYGRLIQREMCDPSQALPHIVEEFIRPNMEEMRLVFQALYPTLPAAEIDRCSFSMVGQVMFYHVMRPAVLLFVGRDEYPRGFTRQLAEHIFEFSLGGMDRLASRRRRLRRAS